MATIDYEKKIREYLSSSEVDQLYKSMLSNLFPELKESEDERIRKAIRTIILSEPDIYEKIGFSRSDCLAWLEKQGEHKKFCDSIQVGDKVTRNEDGELVNLSQLNRVAKKQGEQKPADKVEPRFKVGDWIVRELDNTCYQIKNCILNVTNNKYGYDLTSGGHISSQDANFYHLWTIQDAKDGDMIYASTEEKGVQAIFYKYEGGIIYFHCNLCGDFIADGYMPIGTIEFVSPLQKGHYQRFFEKMHEAGYEWDAEKKELKKIEQKPAEWSEEDKKMIDTIIETIKMSIEDCDVDDIGTKVRFTLEKERDWLKSLKDRYTWKPSVEQVEAFEHFVRSIGESDYASPYDNTTKLLYSLLSDLKKLREE